MLTPVITEPLTLTLLLPALQVPPAVTSFNDTLVPAHSELDPVIACGVALTVTPLTATQPVTAVYVMFTVPAPAPVNIPDVPIVAIRPLLLLHVPLPVSESAVVVPVHKLNVPRIACGLAFTLIVAEVVQPGPTLYTTVPVPADTPVTTPLEDPTVIAAPMLLHEPPADPSLSAVVNPWHTDKVPSTEDG